jgi:DNA-binding GntR family transcriptional regulator
MERAYDEIKRRIITLDLAPGTRLDDRTLSAELRLSRTPVREAVFRLGAERFVELRGREGFVVRPLDLLDITDLLEAHVMLAKAVALLAAQRVTPAQLERLREQTATVAAAIKARDYLAMTSHNAELHRLEAEAAGNTHIQAAANSLEDHRQRLAYLCYGGLGAYRGSGLSAHLRKVDQQHDDMLAALEAHDAAAAQRISLQHVQLFRQRVRDLLDTDSLLDYMLTESDFNGVAPLYEGDTVAS